MLVKGFDRVKMSQKTRWIGKRLSRVLYGALKAMLVYISCTDYTGNQVQLLTQLDSILTKIYILTQPNR